MATKDEAKRRLELVEGNHVCVQIWQAGDVISRAEERGITLTETEANWVLDEMDHRQDASIGINWDTMDFYIDELVKD